jgi:hypothetical protein
LTTNEDWIAMAPGELQVFVDGIAAGCSRSTQPTAAPISS